MKTDFIKDGWVYTTPVYVGTVEQVAKMQCCSHNFYDLAEGDHKEPMIQVCNCGSKRARYEVKKNETNSKSDQCGG